MRFLDTAVWDPRDRRTDLLIELFTKHFPREAQMVWIAAKAGTLEGDLPMGMARARTRWAAALPDHVEWGKLRLLVEAAMDEETSGPSFRRQLSTELLDADVAIAIDASWYQPDAEINSRFVGPGLRLGMVDRDNIRRVLPPMLRSPGLVLVVRGPRGSGKSHLWHLFHHIAKKERDIETIRVRVEDIKKPQVGAVDLASSLGAKLGIDLDLDDPVDPNEQADATGRIAVEDIIGSFPRDRTRRCIVLDGLDRGEAGADAKDFGMRLLQAVANEEIVDTHLIITGFDLPIPRDLAPLVFDEELGAITFTDIRNFFKIVNEHTPRAAIAELDALADRAREMAKENSLNGEASVADLTEAASALARQTFALGAA